MKIEQSTVRKLSVSELDRLDPLTIFLEDLGVAQGRITITCYGESWTAYWGGMGNRTLAQFFLSCNNSYLAKNLSSIKSEVNDPDKLSEAMRKEIITRRRQKYISENEARDWYDATVDSDDLMEKYDLLYRVFGDEWWHAIPVKPNPEYVYLCRIIDAVKGALKEVA